MNYTTMFHAKGIRLKLMNKQFLINSQCFEIQLDPSTSRVYVCNRTISTTKVSKQLFNDTANTTIIRRSHLGRMSKLYRPTNVLPPFPPPSSKPTVVGSTNKDPVSKSQRLMLDNGLINLSGTSGILHLLPLAVKSLEKLTTIIDHFMKKIDCQKLRMPILASSELYKASGRLNDFGSELMRLRDRHSHELLLCPTHEEIICNLVAAQAISHHNLPLRLYQITEKFRDELRPRFGLLRGREFIMKDLYTFDADETLAVKTYDEVNEIYSELFDFIGVKWIKAQGSTGVIGGSISHEFHLISDVGEDTLIICESCKMISNEEVQNLQEGKAIVGTSGSDSTETKCAACGSKNLLKSNAIEVGHTFLLGTKYSKPFHSSFVGANSGILQLLHMGCYGIGVSRLLAAVIEVLSTNNEIRWPLSLAPYLIALIPPKQGSKEENSLNPETMAKISHYLLELLPGETLVDDRIEMTIGRRLKDLKKLGIPFIIVFGKQLREKVPKIEFIDVNNDKVALFEVPQLYEHIYNLKHEWKFLPVTKN